jgi:hypothetical protein
LSASIGPSDSSMPDDRPPVLECLRCRRYGSHSAGRR